MVAIRSNLGSKIKPYSLSDEDIYWIGRLVRACSEIEDLVNGNLCDLAQVTYGGLLLLLGRLSISARIGLAQQFAQAHGGKILKAHKECFESPEFRSILKCRNTVAHGFLMGKTERDEIAFEIQETQGLEDRSVFVTVTAFPPGAIKGYALAAEEWFPVIEERLGLKAWRDERRGQALAPHSKVQASRQRQHKASPKASQA